MGGMKDAPDPPDYGPLAKMSEKSARYSYKLGQDQLEWAKKQYALDSKIIKRIVGTNLEMMDTSQKWAEQDRRRYNKLYRPLERQMVRDAEMARKDMLRRRTDYQPIEDEMLRETLTYGDPAFREQEVGRAAADVALQMEQARKTALSNLESFGINPSSVRYASLDRAGALQSAAMQAAAGMQRRDQIDQTKRGLQDRALSYKNLQEGISRGAIGDAVNTGRGLPSQALAGYGAAMQGGMGAGQQQLAKTASGASTMGTAPQWQGLGNQAVGMWGDILNTGYNNQLNAWQANQQSSSGIGSLLGLGMGLMAPKFGFAEGGEVPDESSPTMGAIEDDVPARLTPGEFVIPKDVVEWYGERHMHQMIMKAKKEMQALPEESEARPDIMMAPHGEEATFTSGGIPLDDEEDYD